MKKVVLLVDDTLTIRMYEKIALGGDYEFLEATNGRIALELAGTRRPDLILLDITMPEMDGIEALRALRSRAETQSIPVIMVTTQSEDALRQTCESIGCQGFVYKPIDRQQLKQRVQEVMGEA